MLDVPAKFTMQEVSSKDRLFAVVTHLVSIPFPVVGPFIAGKVLPSSYAKFHAHRATLGDLKILLITSFAWLGYFSHTVYTAYQAWQSGGESIDWVMLIAKPILWLIAGAVLGSINTLSSIYRAAKAGISDDWGDKGWESRLARKWTK
jgi:hypothetical protein